MNIKLNVRNKVECEVLKYGIKRLEAGIKNYIDCYVYCICEEILCYYNMDGHVLTCDSDSLKWIKNNFEDIAEIAKNYSYKYSDNSEFLCCPFINSGKFMIEIYNLILDDYLSEIIKNTYLSKNTTLKLQKEDIQLIIKELKKLL